MIFFANASTDIEFLSLNIQSHSIVIVDVISYLDHTSCGNTVWLIGFTSNAVTLLFICIYTMGFILCFNTVHSIFHLRIICINEQWQEHIVSFDAS